MKRLIHSISILLAVSCLGEEYFLLPAAGQTISAGNQEPVPSEKALTTESAPLAQSSELCFPKEIWIGARSCDQSRLWVSGEYLLWWIKNGPSPPPLAALGSIADPVPGALGQPGTSVVLGGKELDYPSFSGGRFGAGYWLDSEQRWGVEASGFFLGTRSLQQSVSSGANGSPALFRPFNDVTTGESSFFLSAPGFVSGSLTMSSTSELWGVEANAVMGLIRGDAWQIDALFGYRHLNLDESIGIATFTRDFGDFFGTGFLASPSNPGMFEKIGSTLAVVDSFHTRNQFDGGQLGFHASHDFLGGAYLDVRAQAALGSTHETIDIGGSTIQNQPGLPPAAFGTGVLAGQSNSGHFQHDQFSVVPSVGVRFGYRLRENVRAFVSYDFLYWSDVTRPGDQISRNVDFRSIPTSFAYVPGFAAAAPSSPSFQQSGFWAQGISFGLEFRY